ncbi:MAG: transporter [Spirochaetaceae bacterium]|nr:MAG: transporter [Spirochaetaceae bacterium]
MRIEHHVLYLEGKLTLNTVPAIARRLGKIRRRQLLALKSVDLSGVGRVDSCGLGLIETLRDGGYRKPLPVVNASSAVEDVINTFADKPLEVMPTEPPRGFFSDGIGAGLYAIFHMLTEGLLVAGEVFAASAVSLFIPSRHRKGAISEQIVQIGARGVPIVGLLSFIIGFILALQGAVQLEQFGGTPFIADLMALAMFRELAPLLTAIIVTGRTGSAMASEIGTMQVTNEIDALRAMGIRPYEYVVGPKFIAMTVVMPMLAFLSAVIGIFSGLVVSVFVAGQPARTYIDRSLNILSAGDGLLLLTKSLLFGWAIAAIAVYSGTNVEGGAVEVGKATTNAVVTTTFVVVILNVVFSLVYVL